MRFAARVDYAQLVKIYKNDEPLKIEKRYSPNEFIKTIQMPIEENPTLIRFAHHMERNKRASFDALCFFRGC